ncbi:biogenesis of lysosome-related organelles complex-1, subunit 2, isoform CRA_b [Basidiobolus meristosporus CBS 931.73]|uniref:Biogenesis of lysosome-related organelles complex-1, subunit 2, isoform CRA_b n=1 Tax=Basidiobolus meristosporus CBS 931.73 TaxID=1314790 RepID=A0A1Y1XRN6_9FUNG|nr:biogenesis of lysosome-related organelles complex-1, subunit 2, isoform CRA_b [Basidiobolus meristosporus CBS 931.73]|eukprot:ORX88393.1 biogenesis of lysosome-related organelles complex-1, subunit 2, isoform CRA_b [Basidiobolus meristosporus CBS 931.73]
MSDSPSSSVFEDFLTSGSKTRPRNSSSATERSKTAGKEDALNLSQEMFDKVSEYLKSELLASTQDYKLLETFNNLTKEKYQGMSDDAKDLINQVTKLQQSYASFSTYITQIDDISRQVDFIEQVTAELDEYSKQLEYKFKKVLR